MGRIAHVVKKYHQWYISATAYYAPYGAITGTNQWFFY